ncbi:hypothetical protein Bca52824_016393 [Brassica carinata]|uniref:Uncharacterized protein n=1 Tax=Brassica carinata TaxID=52824 RepID=A0A8X7W6A1_BRACI|nr:hypothetical protein Bca52824_016393 [Brassica carinata]
MLSQSSSDNPCIDEEVIPKEESEFSEYEKEEYWVALHSSMTPPDEAFYPKRPAVKLDPSLPSYKGESAGTTSSHMTYFDTLSYTTKNQPPCLNKGLVKGIGRTMVSLDYYLPPNFSILRSGNVPKRLSKKRRKHKQENIASPGCMPFERSLSSQYSIIGGISKDILTEVNQQFACLAQPYAIGILQTRGYIPPGPYAKNTDPAYLCNVNPRSRIQASDQGSRSPTADSHRYN